MSEYQFYEFRTIDKPLTAKEKEEVSSWSSRTQATNTGAIFTYSYSDFRRDELKVVEKYFDAMFYVSNWGTRRFVFKIPNQFVKGKAKLKQYCVEGLEIREYDDFLLVDICIEDEEGGYGWIEGEGKLTSLITLREDIISGDYRCLYLIWLKVSTEDVIGGYGYVDKESEEPDVPAGLISLSGSLLDFVDIFEIDNDVLSAASTASEPLTPKTSIDYEKQIGALPDEEKNRWLLRLAQNEPLLPAKFKRLLDQSGTDKTFNSKRGKRTVSDIVKGSELIKKERIAHEKKLKKEKHLAKLKHIEMKEKELWEEVFGLIIQKKSRTYEEAVEILASLKELAIHKNNFNTFKTKVETIKLENRSLSALNRRIDAAKLLIEK